MMVKQRLYLHCELPLNQVKRARVLDNEAYNEQNQGNWEDYYGKTTDPQIYHSLGNCRGDYSSYSNMPIIGRRIPSYGHGRFNRRRGNELDRLELRDRLDAKPHTPCNCHKHQFCGQIRRLRSARNLVVSDLFKYNTRSHPISFFENR
jgi:hypothetical protein